MDETDQMQAEYTARLKHCLMEIDKDRRVPYSGVIVSQVVLMAISLLALWSIMQEGKLPSAIVWCMIGFQSSLVSMCLSNWVYQRRGERASLIAWSMLPAFEAKKYADKNLMEQDLLKICVHMTTASGASVLPLSYSDGWRRQASLVGGICSLVMLSAAAFCSEEYLFVLGACFVFGFFAFRSLYIILREVSLISL